MKPTNVVVHSLTFNIESVQNCLEEALAREESWAANTIILLQKVVLAKEDKIAWAAYHSLQQLPLENPPGLCSLLPLFSEKSSTPSMIKHGMDAQQQAIAHLNPGQVPVTTFDQPLFAIAKYIQWKWPATHGEHVHVVMLGGLHTEMALWSTLGDILEESGWTSAIAEAEIATPGVADSFLRVVHLARTRHAHQVTALTLQKLQQQAYLQSGSEISFPVWKRQMCKDYPTFIYWDLVLRYEKLVFIFIRAHIEGNFQLYLKVLELPTPLFFALDHVNHSRWLPIHIRDMKCLPDPIRDKFKRGHWVFSKTKKAFSAIPFDQVHEQENACVKGSGGCIGLMDSPETLKHWMLSSPELAILQNQSEIEYLFFDEEDSKYLLHHESGYAAQATFHKQVNSMAMGNHFLDHFPDLVTLDNRDCMDESVKEVLYALEDVGQKQYQEYVKGVLEDHTLSVHDPIKQNSLALFKRPKLKELSNKGKRIKILQNNVALLGKLYIAM